MRTKTTEVFSILSKCLRRWHSSAIRGSDDERWVPRRAGYQGAVVPLGMQEMGHCSAGPQHTGGEYFFPRLIPLINVLLGLVTFISSSFASHPNEG